jgi:hypothetical protein
MKIKHHFHFPSYLVRISSSTNARQSFVAGDLNHFAFFLNRTNFRPPVTIISPNPLSPTKRREQSSSVLYATHTRNVRSHAHSIIIGAWCKGLRWREGGEWRRRGNVTREIYIWHNPVSPLNRCSGSFYYRALRRAVLCVSSLYSARKALPVVK